MTPMDHSKPANVLSSALESALKNVARIHGVEKPKDVSASSSLSEIESLISKGGLRLDAVLADAALSLANDRIGVASRKGRNEISFLTSDKRPSANLVYTSGSSVTWNLSPDVLRRSLFAANRTIEIVHDLSIANNVPIFELLGLRNLSSFVGEIYKTELCRLERGKFMSNPNQDGYPDLCAMTPEGQKYVEERKKLGQMSAKQYWSPYPFGGVEIKGTCGNTPAASKVAKPKIGESRYPILISAEWKAHHQETNNLLGIYWDFVDGLPTVLAVFFRNDLEQKDWGEIIHPKEGGGRTTSVSIMTRDGVKKMAQGWAVLPNHLNILQALSQDRVFSLSRELIARYSSEYKGVTPARTSK
jgi:hypothetical protein